VKRLDAPQGLAAGAAVVTVALTAAAFWLSYEHLHDVADSNGLDGVRAWAWPATVDLFIVSGELLILRASLRHLVDWWAVSLAASGSLGSIALNVFGVGTGAAPLEYVVAAVPPVAALLAFGALMRQVHEHLASRAEPVSELPVPVTLDRVPETYPGLPAPVPAVPEAVPAGVRLPPIDARTESKTYELDAFAKQWVQSRPPAVPAAEHPRTRPEVRAEYVPDEVPDDEPVLSPDPLVGKAQADFPEMCTQGRTPSVRTLRSTYSIGQARAQRIRDELQGALL
jgi:hypothetical protein